ncbi:MAG: FixH family protein [Anaerolineae bacterium]
MTTAATSRKPIRLSRKQTIIGSLIALVVIAAGYVAFTMIKMSYVPPNLDYSLTRPSDSGLYRVTYSSSQTPVPVNELHTWKLHVETADGKPVDNATISIFGDMPQHGHGMPTKPQVTQNLGNGDYLVEGMKFQMGGWWKIDFTINANGQSDMVSFNLMLQK